MLTNTRRTTTAIVLILAALSSFLFLFQLGKHAFKDYDEAGYARIVQETIDSGQSVTLIADKKPWFDKPPLYFWMAEGLTRLGLPDEWAMRLPAALFGIASILIVFAIAYEVAGLTAGLLSALILLSTGAYLMTGREVKLDVPVTFFFLAAVFSYIKSKKDDRWLAGIGIAAGFAIMVKSVIGILVYPIIFAFALAYKDVGILKNKKFWIGNLFGLALALPWHAYEYFAYGNKFFQDYVLFNIFSRYQSDILNNSATIATYFETFWYFAMPWMGFFVISVAGLAAFWKRMDPTVRRVIVGCILSVFGIFILFSISKTKIPYYLIPLYPFVALTIGIFLGTVYKIFSSEGRQKILVVILLLALYVGSRQAIAVGMLNDDRFNIETKFANEEKVIGTVLAGTPEDTIYFDTNWYALTVRYYSGKYTEVLQKDRLPDRPFYLVVFLREAYNEPFYNQLLVNADSLYKGEYIGLYLVK